MKHGYISQVGNVLIRPLLKSEIEFIRCWRNIPENTKYLRQIPYITSDMQLHWYRNDLDDQNCITFAIEETEKLHRIVGSLAIYNFEDRQAEIGKILVGDPEAHGMSVGANAFKAAVHVAFEVLGMEKVVLHVFADNIPAVKSYMKAGFQIEDEHIIDGKKEYLMSIIKLKR